MAKRSWGPKPAAKKKAGTKKPATVKQLAAGHKKAVKADTAKKAAKAAEKRIEKTEVTWQRLFALRESWLAHDAAAKEHAKAQVEAEKNLKEVKLTPAEHKTQATKAWDAKQAKSKCQRTMRLIVLEMFKLLDSFSKGEQIDFRVEIPKPPDAPPPSEPLAERETGTLQFPKAQIEAMASYRDFSQVKLTEIKAIPAGQIVDLGDAGHHTLEDVYGYLLDSKPIGTVPSAEDWKAFAEANDIITPATVQAIRTALEAHIAKYNTIVKDKMTRDPAPAKAAAN